MRPISTQSFLASAAASAAAAIATLTTTAAQGTPVYEGCDGLSPYTFSSLSYRGVSALFEAPALCTTKANISPTPLFIGALIGGAAGYVFYDYLVNEKYPDVLELTPAQHYERKALATTLVLFGAFMGGLLGLMIATSGNQNG